MQNLASEAQARVRAMLDRGFIDEYVFQVATFSNIRPQVLLEIGALDGAYARLLANDFAVPDAGIHLVEPNPALTERLLQEFPSSKVFPVAIGSGSVHLNRVVSTFRSAIGSASCLERIDAWARQLVYEAVPVETMTGHALLEAIDTPIDLCIVDVEGAAFQALESCGDRISQIRSLMIECEHSEIFKGQKLFDDVAGLLRERGFRQMAFRYSYANQSDSIWIHESVVNLSAPLEKLSDKQ